MENNTYKPPWIDSFVLSDYQVLNLDMEISAFNSGGNPWSTYMVGVYAGRRGPQPLGTVVFEEIEAKAREKLKDYGGAFAVILPILRSFIYKV